MLGVVSKHSNFPKRHQDPGISTGTQMPHGGLMYLHETSLQQAAILYRIDVVLKENDFSVGLQFTSQYTAYCIDTESTA